MGGKKTAAMLPKERPDLLRVGFRNGQGGDFAGVEKREFPLGMRGGSRFQARLTSNKNISQCAWPW